MSACNPSQCTRPWQPILTGAAQAQAMTVVQTIAASLHNPPPPNLPPELAPEIHQAAATASLSGGVAGLAVLFGYLAQVTGHSEDKSRALGFLEQAMEQVAVAPMGPALHGGFTGVGWTVAHLLNQVLAPADEDPNETFDEILCDYVRRSPWPGEYDLIGGLVGIGVYALERLPNLAAVQCLTHLIDRLDELAEPTAQGLRWHTAPEMLSAWQRELCPNGYYNLGLAHGVPGIIALLGAAYRAGIAKAKTHRLLVGAVNWTLAQQLDETAESCFPNWVGPDLTPEPTRSAWCYGDPGVAIALLGAAYAANEPAWAQAAITVARRAAQRPVEQAFVRDACLCHGAAGLGHLFNRLFQATGDPVLGEAARFWLQRTLDMQQTGQGIAGFATFEPNPGRASPWVADPGLLTGVAGIALVLLAAATPLEPLWDRTLLLALPLRGRAVLSNE